MSIKEKLQIIVITYNREKFLKKTLDSLLTESSPVKDFSILVLDNNSTDSTFKLVEELQKQNPNLKYKKNNYNLGIGGNIARALELADMEYVWLLADDDIIYWDAWPYLEEAVNAGKEVICAANYVVKDSEKNDYPSLLMQMTFVSCNIYKTSIITNTTMANIVNNIYTLFPHLVPAIEQLNKNGEIHLLKKPLVNNDMQPNTDCSYIRGYDNRALYLKQRSMSWIVGYANILPFIKDKKTRYETMQKPILNGIHTGWMNFYKAMYTWYAKEGNWLPIFEAARQIPWTRRLCLFAFLFSPIKILSGEKGVYMHAFKIIKTKIWRKHV